MRPPPKPPIAAGISIADIFSVFIGVVPFVGFRLSFHAASALAMLWLSVSGCKCFATPWSFAVLRST